MAVFGVGLARYASNENITGWELIGLHLSQVTPEGDILETSDQHGLAVGVSLDLADDGHAGALKAEVNGPNPSADTQDSHRGTGRASG
jgi:hypothetical protein